MNNLVKIIKSTNNETLVDEDGDSLNIEWRKGCSLKDISMFEMKNCIVLPENLKALLLFTNGINLFGLSILSIEEMEVFPYTQLLSFHNWGNGDFDCVSIGGNYNEGSVVFKSHTEGETFWVVNSLEDWFKEVISEIKKTGALLHPLDYSIRDSNGMYKIIQNKIKKW